MPLQIILNAVLIFAFFWNCNAQDLPEGCFDTSKTGGRIPGPRVILVTGKGFLYSPGFEENKNYPDNVQCSYQLQAYPSSGHVRLHFNVFDLDATEHCTADYLNIHDFDSNGQGKFISKHCGDQAPFDYVSNSFAVQLVLRSDGFAGGKGFNITYSAQSTTNVCSASQKQCRNRNCVDNRDLCDGNDNCGDGTDEEKCGNVLPISECGKPEIDPVTFADMDRIIGGKEAVYGSWPWMVDLQAITTEPNAHICGGALINAQWVLTAAHCVGSPDLRVPGGWRIHIGNHHKFKKDAYEQIRYAERLIVYGVSSSQFEQDGKYDLVDDMTLIKLNAPVKFSKYVKPICLAEPGITLDQSSKCYATGWGSTRGTGGANVLKQDFLRILSDDSCRRFTGSNFVPRTMICTGSTVSFNGVCHGDSGGPLVCETKKGQWNIVGVASYVIDSTGLYGFCGLQGKPSVYNRVSVKNDWIRQMVNRYS